MKKCDNCQMYSPDNFYICPICGNALPHQPDENSIPLQMFMYNEQMGNALRTGNSTTWIVTAMLVAVFSFAIIIPAVTMVSQSNYTALIITMAVWFAVILATIISAIIIAFKKGSLRTAYIYSQGVLYRIMLWGGKGTRIKSGKTLKSQAASVYAKTKFLQEFEKKAATPEPYLRVFLRYLRGETVWSNVYGGDGKVDALRGFRITGQTRRQYNYTYIDDKGRMRSDKLLKCYPNIETVFGYCR